MASRSPGTRPPSSRSTRAGKFAYTSNRGHHSIAIYTVDQSTGRLTHVGNQSTFGETPRNFCIDPSGKYILAANQDTHNVVVFQIHPETGLLTPTGSQAKIPSPVCVKFWTMK